MCSGLSDFRDYLYLGGKKMKKALHGIRSKPIKKPLILLLVTLFLFTSVSSALATRDVLSVPEYSQQPYDQICWATSAAMVVSFFLDDTTNRNVEIAQAEFGEDEFNQPSWNMEPYVEDYTGESGSTQSNSLSYTAVQNQVNNDGPIITVIYWSEGGSHAEVIKGYDTSTDFVLYNDPWDGLGHGATYSYYEDNDDWTWDWSLFWR